MKQVLAALLAPLLCCGCPGIAVPVVKEALKCDVPADMLAACAEPVAVKPGVTFGEMIELSARDRDSFKACALRHKSLAETVVACNASIEKYNAEIREINARNAKQ
jgi:hypothetical protein